MICDKCGLVWLTCAREEEAPYAEWAVPVKRAAARTGI